MTSKLTDDAAEVLEAVWTLEEQNQACVENIAREASAQFDDRLLAELQEAKLIEVDHNQKVTLLQDGRNQAMGIIRRHRLAERLICDILGKRVEETEDAACEFEHLIAEGITSSICTLLGHPRLCPHHKPIPEGECCRQAREELKPVVIPADVLAVGKSARVAYIASREHGLIQKLSALGVGPGVHVKLLQKWPSCVIQCEETEVAVESAVAHCIYVWQD